MVARQAAAGVGGFRRIDVYGESRKDMLQAAEGARDRIGAHLQDTLQFKVAHVELQVDDPPRADELEHEGVQERDYPVVIEMEESVCPPGRRDELHDPGGVQESAAPPPKGGEGGGLRVCRARQLPGPP